MLSLLDVQCAWDGRRYCDASQTRAKQIYPGHPATARGSRTYSTSDPNYSIVPSIFVFS